MDIDHAVLKISGDQYVIEITAHDHQLDAPRTTQIKNGLAVFFRRTGLAARNRMSFDVGCTRELKSGCSRAAANDQAKVDWQCSRVRPSDQVAQRRAAA